MSTTPRFDAWLQIVIGGGLLLAGLASLLDTGYNRILIGAMIVGPIFVLRGIGRLKQLAEAQRALLPTWDDQDLDQEDGEIDGLAARHDSQHVRVSCEACREEYVYFPDAVSSARETYRRQRLCIAPCPKCGKVQEHMIDLARKMGYVAVVGAEWAYRGLLILIGSGLFFVFNVARIIFGGDDPYQWIYWSANQAMFLAGLGCVVAGYVAANRLPDPNRVPLERRLRRGQWMGMSLAEYEAIRNGQGLDESK